MFLKFALTMTLIACALYDVIQYRIPNVLTVGVALLFVVWVVTHPLPLATVGDHVFVGVVVLACAAILFRFRLLGGGDVKLLAATCLWAGPYAFIAHLVLTSFVAAGLLLVLVAARWLYPAMLAIAPRFGAIPTPKLLRRGEGIPYGLAIAASAIALGLPRTF
jgi:prepilin peptidase CpaA